MKMTHEFHEKHGFSGSAKPNTEFAPSIPGFKRGGKVDMIKIAKKAVHEHEEHEHGGKKTELHLKHGGRIHEKHYKEGGKIRHDFHEHNDGNMHIDEHGFQIHKGHDGKRHKEEE